MVALLGSIERRSPRAIVYLGVGVVLTRWWLGLVNGEIVSFEQSKLIPIDGQHIVRGTGTHAALRGCG